MEKKKNFVCAWVSGNEDSLKRAVLREEFSKFGAITKIFIDADLTYAKVYMNDLESLKLSCDQLNGHNGWTVKHSRDSYIPRDQVNSPGGYEAPKQSRSHTSLNQSFGSVSNDDLDEMDEECVYAGSYVDVRGRPVEVLQGENGALYVNLDDVRTGGYNIYKKEAFENTTISEDIDLRHLENYLLNQGMKYVIETRKKFDEQEMLNVFERVRAKLETKSSGFAGGRVINAPRDSKNITITMPNVPSPTTVSPQGNRAPKKLDANFQPSFSHTNARPIRDNRVDDRQNGPATFSNGPRRPYGGKYENRSDTRKENWSGNRGDGKNEGRRPYENNMGSSAEVSQNHTRPRPNFEYNRTKAMAHSSANNEPEETWEGPKTPVPQSQPQIDATASKTPVPQSQPQIDATASKTPVPQSQPQIDTTASKTPVPQPEPQIDITASKTPVPQPEPQIDTTASRTPVPQPEPQIDTTVLKTPVPQSEPQIDTSASKTPVPQSKPQLERTSVGSQRSKPLSLKRSVLAINELYKIKVSYIKPDKSSLFYSQWLENVNQIDEILLHVNSVDLHLPEIVAPARDMLCVAFFEECWYRAVVLLEKPGSGGVFAELIDYGNKEMITLPLREMSAEMKKIPGMAIRTAVSVSPGSDPNELSFKTEQVLEVYVKKHISDEYDDLTHLVEIKRILDGEPASPQSGMSSDHEKPEKPTQAAVSTTDKPAVSTTDKPAVSATEDCFMEIPPSTAKLANGEGVMIVGYTSTNLILRNKETAMNCKRLYSHLSTMEKKPIANPKVGQLVLCSSDSLEGMHRAIIKQINNQVAVLEYLDYYGEETLTLKSLRNMDKALAAFPIAKLESPVVEWIKTVTEKSEIYLGDLITNKTKLKVVLNGSEFDLVLPGDQEKLSEKIKTLESPPKETPKEPVAASIPTTSEPVAQTPPPPKQVVVQRPVAKAVANNDKYVKVAYDDMPYAKAKLGVGTYTCYNYTTTGSVTLLSHDADEHLEKLLVIDTEDEPYEPEEFDMCLGKWEEIWCRAVLLSANATTSELMFVDFGNTEEIPKSDVRKFPKEFAHIPMLGIGAYFMGIPNDPKVHARIKELIPDETELQVNVKTDLNEELKYGIEIPSVYEALREEKLI